MGLTRLSDERLLELLRANKSEGLVFFYQHSYPTVERYVQANQGTAEEARDVFHDTLLIVLNKVDKPDFQLTASLNTYVVSISKHLWLQHLKRKKRFASLDVDELDPPADESADTAAKLSPFKLIGAILSSITATCLTLLTALFFQRKSIDALMHEMGYANRHTAQNQKYKCLMQARRQGRALLDRIDE
ncbi:RNA polymerase sigma factor [Spirosoma radiotolerans]|uniref:RNA polymerase sigma-70 region 2 domain-containing protein n=1 Tax=Spirosoma radiotolerans TaxID=1379870 RepID=A0A0E3V9H2_9BACT|nr:sigma factor [Spirosoma radiotolerans]AKD57141.1 hypothetical protein SD10_21825 [Spirosoma radiotolerans]